jgi:hypothetical protein
MKTTAMNVFGISVLCAACVLLAAGTAEAKPDKDKGGKGGGKPGHSEKQKGGGKHENKGKADKRGKPLPPGWQKKVQGGYVIEDDLKDYFQPLEYSLFPGVEAVPDTRLYLYGNRIVRVYEPRREVIDLIEVPTIRFD